MKEQRQEFITENQTEWKEIGQACKQGREELGLSLAAMSRKLGTSTSRLRNFENGSPVSMAAHLESSYELVLELERTKGIKEEIHNEVEVYRDFINDTNLRDSFKSRLEGIVDIGKYDKDFECETEKRLLEEIEEDIEMEEYQEALANGAERPYGKISNEDLKSQIDKQKQLVDSVSDKVFKKVHKDTLNKLREEQIHRIIEREFPDLIHSSKHN